MAVSFKVMIRHLSWQKIRKGRFLKKSQPLAVIGLPLPIFNIYSLVGRL